MAKRQPVTSEAVETRQKLLEAAGEIFAEQGFRMASVRDICQRARANVAAVNYHFGDKQRLYSEVLHFAHTCTAPIEEIRQVLQAPVSPAERLGLFVQGFLKSFLASGRPAWAGQLMAREMVEPTEALDEIVEQQIRPKFAVLRELVANIIGVPVEHESVRWYAACVIAQCLFWHNNRAIIERLYPDLRSRPDYIEFLAQHITRFSLSGLLDARKDLKHYQAKGRK